MLCVTLYLIYEAAQFAEDPNTANYQEKRDYIRGHIVPGKEGINPLAHVKFHKYPVHKVIKSPENGHGRPVIFIEANFREPNVDSHTEEWKKVNPDHYPVLHFKVRHLANKLNCGFVQHRPVNRYHVDLTDHCNFSECDSDKLYLL